jgi:cytochrome c-type biogenesis protein CcmE
MNPKRKRRLALVFLLLLGVGTSVALALTAFKQNLQLFYSPTQISAGEAPTDHVIRVGGMVMAGSLQRATDSLKIHFDVTDTAKHMTVNYEGILPDLFREGQGIVAIGKIQPDGSFLATEILAKHDENYMPPEVADAVKTAQQGGEKAANP